MNSHQTQEDQSTMETSPWDRRRRRLFEIVEVGNDIDWLSRGYDFMNTFFIIVNLAASILYTFDNLRSAYGFWLLLLEKITVAAFCVDYLLRLITARYLYPEVRERRALLKYTFSFTGIVDLLSFLPYYLPFFFPSGAIAFRIFRIVRIFRLFRINAYYDSLNVITEVITSKRQQLFSSVFIILVLMLASSLCMYSLEHKAQPEVFSNAFSGIWWSVSTLLTVGYGDIYPITSMGKLFGIFISFLGVGMVAIPTGIISAGFVDQYSHIKRISEYGQEEAVHFIKIQLKEHDSWVGQTIAQLGLPEKVIVAVIKRNQKILIPRGDTVLNANDTIVLGAESFQDREHINLKEVVLQKHNPWNGQRIRDLDISRKTVIILVKRKNKALIPNGNMILREGDTIILYTQMHLANSNNLEIDIEV